MFFSKQTNPQVSYANPRQGFHRFYHSDQTDQENKKYREVDEGLPDNNYRLIPFQITLKYDNNFAEERNIYQATPQICLKTTLSKRT